MNVCAFACIKYEGRKCGGKEETAMLAAMSGKRPFFCDMKSFVVEGMLGWQGSPIAQLWNQLEALLKDLSKIMCFLGQINPVIHLSVPLRNGRWKDGKTDLPASLLILLHKECVVCPGTCKPRVHWWQKRNRSNPAEIQNTSNLSNSSVKHSDRNESAGLYLGEKGTPVGTREKLCFWHCCQSYQNSLPTEGSTSLESTCDPAHASSFQGADCESSGSRDTWNRERIWRSIIYIITFGSGRPVLLIQGKALKWDHLAMDNLFFSQNLSCQIKISFSNEMTFLA